MTMQNFSCIPGGGGIVRAFWKDTLLLLFSQTACSWQACWGRVRASESRGLSSSSGPAMWLGPSVLTPVCHYFTGKHGSFLFLCNCHSVRTGVGLGLMPRTPLGNVGSVVYLSALIGRGTVTSETWDSVTNRESSSNEWALDIYQSASVERGVGISEPRGSAVTASEFSCPGVPPAWVGSGFVTCLLCPETEAEPGHCGFHLCHSTHVPDFHGRSFIGCCYLGSVALHTLYGSVAFSRGFKQMG